MSTALQVKLVNETIPYTNMSYDLMIGISLPNYNVYMCNPIIFTKHFAMKPDAKRTSDKLRKLMDGKLPINGSSIIAFSTAVYKPRDFNNLSHL